MDVWVPLRKNRSQPARSPRNIHGSGRMAQRSDWAQRTDRDDGSSQSDPAPQHRMADDESRRQTMWCGHLSRMTDAQCEGCANRRDD